ncbi:MAG TPA: ferritin-like domain-containing protein [Kofleriaceae bacterium]|nr:ferritin-like domain-containing protein [Kofleriaceae bacterium]
MSTTQDAAAGPSIETLEASLDVTYTWGYQDTRAQLRDLYSKAKRSQWLPEEVLDFSIDVDLGRPMMPEPLHPLFGSEIYAKLTTGEKDRLNGEMASWTLSQFLHGEQGALLAAAQLVTSVPDLDSKLYGATQVVDEARHVDVYNRYLHEKIGFSYPVSPHLKTLLDLILTDSRWDMKFLGMQIMVEGLALAAFALMRQNSYEPLLRDLTRYVMGDEARHVAYGVLSLRDHYAERSEAERREREDFVYEASVLMRDRFLMQEVWEKMGLPVARCTEIALHNKGQVMFRQWLFSKIVPAIKKIGLLSDRQRERFQQLGILQFEDAEDPIEALEKSEAEQAAAARPAVAAV